MSSEPTSIVRIGAGSFATVYVCQGYNNLAFKRVADPGRGAELRKEHDDLLLLYQTPQLLSPDSLFKVPRPDAFFPSYAEFRLATSISQPELEEPALNDAAVCTMERVWPVPRLLAARIRQLFFPEQHRGNEQLFLARLYLGREVRAASRFFNPLNFPLDSSRLQQLQLPVDCRQIAWHIGRCLAAIHFLARRDARDVEFVLGGKDMYAPAFFCIDFNQMRPWSEAEQLADSIVSNDPYFPRPDSENWQHFSLGYLCGAAAERDMLPVAEQVLELLRLRWAPTAPRPVSDTAEQSF